MIRKIIALLQDIFAPQVCFTCGVFIAQEEHLCKQCIQLIQPIVSTIVTLKNGATMQVRALGGYDGPLKKLILAKSYSALYASKVLGKLICENMKIDTIDADIIVPVPLHWTRYAWRGFNQSHEIAKQMGKASGKKVIHLLTRKKRTLFQSLMSGKERQANVKNVFTLVRNAHVYSGKKILIVDDLYTSGATVQEMANELALLKPERITTIVAARVIATNKK